MTPAPGLRERKKQRTSIGLWLAAMDLFATRGVVATTVADIAAAAGTSERTFFRYYPTKEGLTVGVMRANYDALVATVMNRDRDEPLLHGIAASVVPAYAETYGCTERELDGEIRGGTRHMLKVIYANAELRLALHEIMVGAQYRLAELVSHRWGMQAGRDPRPHALAQVAVSLFQETTQWWANDPSKTLQETAEAVCDVALRGERSLAQPPAPRTPLT